MIDNDGIVEFATEDAPGDAALASVGELARRQIEAEELVAKKEAELKDAEHELTALRDELLPQAMAAVGIESFALPGGFKVGVKDTYVCGQLDDAPDDGKKRPLNERLTALKLLDEEGHGDLARRIISVTLGARSDELAKALMDVLRTHPQANQFKLEQRRVIPWNTLSGFAKERVEAGDSPDLHALGVSVIRRSKITRPKKPIGL